MNFTHCYSISNTLGLLIRYNEQEDSIEYKYSDETEVKTSEVHYDDYANPYILIEGNDEKFYLDDFCKINM